MLQYEGCVVPLKLLLVGVYIMKETFCEIDFSSCFSSSNHKPVFQAELCDWLKIQRRETTHGMAHLL